jgi:phosphoribosylanthranilate isomerase
MLLKASSINSLTDARFFSAAGAAFLGFSFDALHSNAITVEKAKEIISWLHGAVIVGEFGAHQPAEEIRYLAQQVSVSEIQIPFHHPGKADLPFKKFLIYDRWQNMHEVTDDLLVLKVTPPELYDNAFMDYIARNKIFLDMSLLEKKDMKRVKALQPYGVQITCRNEETPGLSDVDEYAETLEILGW